MKEPADPRLCADPGVEKFRAWFCALSRSRQLVYGPAILTACAWVVAHELTQDHAADAPDRGIFWTLVLIAASVVLTELTKPKPRFENARPKGLGDFRFPTATEGRPVQLIFGRVLMEGVNVVWYGDLRQDAIVEKVKTGLWSSERVTRGFRYFIGMQLAIGRGRPGALVKLHRVIVKKKEVFTDGGTPITTNQRFDIDIPEFLGGDEFGSGGIQATCDFYGGGADDTDQPVSDYLNVVGRQRLSINVPPVTEFDAPRYTGTAHLVVRELTSAAPTAATRGAYLGNSTSIPPWSVEVSRTPAVFSGQSTGDNVIGSDGDVNPINVIVEIFTDTEFGFGLAASKLDVGSGSSFKRASDRMIAEALGFSMLVDSQTEALDLIAEVLRQIDAVVYVNASGVWEIKLIRGPDDPEFGYDIDTVPQINDDNIVSISDFTRSTWRDTTNQVQVRFDKRADLYKQSHALGQNPANAAILGGLTVLTPLGTPGISDYPGVKDPNVAARIAWRDIRSGSYPLSRGTFTTTRELYAVTLGDVVAWTSTRRGVTKMPLRVTGIDYGDSKSNSITFRLVQDVFTFRTAVFAAPPDTGWTPPATSLVAFPTEDQLAIEAPRALVTRDPSFTGDAQVSKILAAARRQASELAFEVGERNGVSNPSGGAFSLAGSVVAFAPVGQLAADLAAGTAVPTTLINVNATPSSTGEILAEAEIAPSVDDLGVGLANLVYVGDSTGGEFMLCTGVTLDGSNVDLDDVYRGVLDTAQQSHAAGTTVWMLFAGAGVSDSNVVRTNFVDVELRMRSSSDTYAGSVTTIEFQMSRRTDRPYPVAAPLYNGGSTAYATPDLEGDGSGLNGVGFDVDFIRRPYNPGNEVSALSNDVDPGMSDEYRVRVWVAPSGANTLVFDSGWSASTTQTPTQAAVTNAAAAGTEIRVQVDHRHTVDGDVLEATIPTRHDVTPTSTRSAQFYLGGELAVNAWSNVYTAAASGTFTVNAGASVTVEYRINGGSPATAISASTTGTIPGVVATDTIEIRRTTTGAADPNFVEIVNPSAVEVAYGVLS